ncbi:RNA methyltransferase [Carbonactinospora thermoautotrophica]|uniref:RNA methyltransferase n=1 Tax=Carbonactinospora thermoautotrophica TaxID=1469144 RepID=A0A132N581_9ACTN|nr:RNA methyltransferase [Carbonactinospora thermoautotrophica]KWX05254.1 RNA methyltransferase [Carbonactinospora thermoautotrophica]KWX08732.1 RNA methyltransferase [Carbonactinospora thermoautotrophica]
MASPELTSTRSPRVVKARRLAKRSFRAADRKFLAEGPQAVREAAATPGVLLELFVTAEAASRHADIVEQAHQAGTPVHRVSGEVMASICQTVTPQGIVGVCRFVDVSLDEVVASRPPLVAVLAHVRDPGNAGTVLRTADAAGAEAVIVTDASVDLYNGKCVRASAGSLFHVPVVVGVPVAETISRLRDAGLRVLAADGSGPYDLDSELDTGGLAGPTAWVFGNEAWGLPRETLELADAVVRVPIHGRAESLNLATAAAVCLYASARAQRRPGGCRIRS